MDRFVNSLSKLKRNKKFSASISYTAILIYILISLRCVLIVINAETLKKIVLTKTKIYTFLQLDFHKFRKENAR